MKIGARDQKNLMQGYTRRELPPLHDKKAVALSAKHLKDTIDFQRTHEVDHKVDRLAAEEKLARLKKRAKGRTK